MLPPEHHTCTLKVNVFQIGILCILHEEAKKKKIIKMLIINGLNMEKNSFIKQSNKQFLLCVLFTEYCAVSLVNPLTNALNKSQIWCGG